MDSHQLRFLVLVAIAGGIFAANQRGPKFDDNYNIIWGYDHVLPRLQGRDVQISLDKSSGSGIESKLSYLSGFFHMRMKLPANDSAGVVTAFYMKSLTTEGNELDFEFLGDRVGKPYVLQTNVIVNGRGNREQRIHLWFDPTTDYHTYRILWNPHQIVFYVDRVPIRVFKNKSDIGVDYPTQPMNVLATIWNGESWATDGGRAKVDWNWAPFKAHLRSFGIDGCSLKYFRMASCYSEKLWWNRNEYWALDPVRERAYQNVKNEFMTYDYCNDRGQHPKPPPECPQ